MEGRKKLGVLFGVLLREHEVIGNTRRTEAPPKTQPPGDATRNYTSTSSQKGGIGGSERRGIASAGRVSGWWRCFFCMSSVVPHQGIRGQRKRCRNRRGGRGV